MARGKHLSFEEARKKRGGLKRFANEHPSTGDRSRFNRLFQAMAEGRLEGEAGTSGEDASAGYGGTRPRKDTSEDAS